MRRRCWFFAGLAPLAYARAAPPDPEKTRPAAPASANGPLKSIPGGTDDKVGDEGVDCKAVAL